MRGVGAVLIVMMALPWYELVGIRGGGPATEQTLRLGALYLAEFWSGTLLGAGAIAVLSVLLKPDIFEQISTRGSLALRSLDIRWYAATCAVVAAIVSGWVSVSVLGRQPPLLDGVAQLVQARYLASGELTGPLLEEPAFWQFQFMVSSPAGWVSQYAPGFAAAMAVIIGLGASSPWLLGPALAGLAVLLTGLISDRLLPHDPTSARLGTLFTALSPFLVFHAGAFMSHALALVLVLTGVWAALRSWEGSRWWTVVAGASVGALLLTRPYTGVYYGAAIFLIAFRPGLGRGKRPFGDGTIRVATAAMAALPLVLLLGAYNRHVFGGVLSLGYVVAEGPGHGLGFHFDPWGVWYGPVEAIGYMSADLLSLSLDLLQTPIPALLVVGAYLLTGPQAGSGLMAVLGLAVLPVFAHLPYWHHDQFMGPRLLYESIPWWCLLFAVSLTGLMRRAPQELRGPWGLRMAPRSGIGFAFVVAILVAVGYASPAKLTSYSATVLDPEARGALREQRGAALAFVHTGWQDRIAARLAEGGMRLDSVRAALRQNSSCALERYLQGQEAVEEGGDGIRIDITAGRDPRLTELQMPSGSVIMALDGETMVSECERQAQSDFDGILALPSLVWRGDLPGLGSSGVMFVRDLGPQRNASLLRAFPDREPLLLVRTREQGLRWVPYQDGIRRRWSLP